MHYKALVIDDDNLVRSVMRKILINNGFVVVECSNGREAIAQLAENIFDVVICDRHMPEMDGFAFCQWLRNTHGDKLLPVIMVNASSDPESLQQCLQAGADDFIRKPFIHDELLARSQTAAERKRLTDQLDNAESVLFSLARMVEAKDECTGDHCGRLLFMGKHFGKYLGLDSTQILALSRGGVLHDIGKLGIADSILLKPGKLDDDEMATMRTHTIIGYQLCKELGSLSATLPLIHHHHERWDGSGYPDKLKGEEIPLLARIFQILDIYDALRSERPYKKSFSREKSLAILAEELRMNLLDPTLTDQFITMMTVAPVDAKKAILNDAGYMAYKMIHDLEPLY
ncbi:MAG: HD domain-containing phosphohydrolase [Pseudomonadales bacterium]